MKKKLLFVFPAIIAAIAGIGALIMKKSQK